MSWRTIKGPRPPVTGYHLQKQRAIDLEDLAARIYPSLSKLEKQRLKSFHKEITTRTFDADSHLRFKDLIYDTYDRVECCFRGRITPLGEAVLRIVFSEGH